MKKFASTVLLCLFLTGALLLTACGSQQDEAVVGTWHLSDDSLGAFVTYVFDADGTGSRAHELGRETFRWSTSGTRLNVNRDSAPSGEIRNERWTYTITGNQLVIDSQQETGWVFTYHHAAHDSNLVGTWLWYDDFEYVFNVGGTGHRQGADIPHEPFTWATAGPALIMTFDDVAIFGVMLERWAYNISGNTLSLDSLQADGLVFDYTRAN